MSDGPDTLSDRQRPRKSGPRLNFGADVVDAKTVLLTRRRQRALLLFAVATLLFAIGGAVSWKHWIEPRRQEALVEEAMATLSKRRPEDTARLSATPEEARLRVVAEVVLDRKQFDPPQPATAEAALRTAMRRGGRDAALDLGIMYRDGRLGPSDPKSALKLFDEVRGAIEPAARAGESAALILMARITNEGLGVEADQSKAIELALRGAANGSAEQKVKVGDDRWNGWGVFKGRPDEKEAIRIIEQAAETGSIEGIEKAGLFLSQGANKEGRSEAEKRRLNEKSLYWYEMAARLGRVDSMAEAGETAWELGKYNIAKKWLEAAHQAGSKKHSEILGLIRIIDSSVPLSGQDLLRDFFDHGDSEFRRSNAISGWAIASSALEFEDLTHQQRVRAALTCQAWVFVLESIGSALKDGAVALCSDRLTLIGPARARLHAEARHLAELITSPPARASSGATLDQPSTATGGTTANEATKGSIEAMAPQHAIGGDVPPQTKSGFLSGAPRERRKGLGTYTIDNTAGAGGATVRLYLNGELPAAYSFFVQQGDAFTARAIAPGTYVMRYRNLGSDTIYEADQQFVFQQQSTTEGTSYASIKVTLYPVSSGNMRTTQVDAMKF